MKVFHFKNKRIRAEKNDIRSSERVRVETCDSRKCEMVLFPEFSVALNFYAV